MSDHFQESKRKQRAANGVCGGFRVEKRPDPLQPDVYSAKFLGIEEFTGGKQEFGPGVKLKFEVTEGEFKGRSLFELAPAKFFANSKLMKFAEGLRGETLDEDEDFDFRDYIGVTGTIEVDINDKGYNKVVSFTADYEAEPLTPWQEFLAGHPEIEEAHEAHKDDPIDWSTETDPFHPGDMEEDLVDYGYAVEEEVTTMPSVLAKPTVTDLAAVDPIDRLWYWIKERHLIWQKRKQGWPKPWTKDPILQEWRFCNVYRERDTVTRWIADNWRTPHKDDPDLWFAMVVARWINWPDSLAEIGYPVPWNPDHFVGVLADRMRRKEKVFTGAYMIHADLHFSGSKSDYLAERVFGRMWDDRKTLRRIAHGTLADAHRLLLTYHDVGSFMAGQVIADLKYVDPLRQALDWHTWAASGPGSQRGLNRVLDRPLKSKWLESNWLRELQELHREIDERIVAAGMPELHAQDLQNCLCEMDKFERVRLGEGKPRSQFPGMG